MSFARQCARLLALAAVLPLAAQENPPSPAAEARPAKLKPGEFTWHPERSPQGPVLVVVSRDEQIAYVYRNGIEIARSTVSTGKPGHGTPVGVFQILQKRKDHHSSIYKNAPMPYMQRLTWEGIALHAGNLPGYPASHGCVRLPYAFSQKLFDVTTMGGAVVITSERTAPTNSLTPYEIFKTAGKNLMESGKIRPISPDIVDGWFPEKQVDGQLSIVVSSGDQAIHVLRDGVAIGRTKIEFTEPGTVLPTGVFVMLDRETDQESPVVQGRKHKAWAMVALDKASKPGDVWKNASKLKIPADFLQVLYEALSPGTLLIVTADKLDPEKRSATDMVLVDAENPTLQPPAN